MGSTIFLITLGMAGLGLLIPFFFVWRDVKRFDKKYGTKHP